MVLPLFDYCVCFSDSCGVGSKECLKKLNRTAACITKGRSGDSLEIKELFQWPNLQFRRDYSKFVLVYKSLHDLVPTNLLADFGQTYARSSQLSNKTSRSAQSPIS